MKKREEMVQQSSHLSKTLDELILSKTAFVLFKKPDENAISILVQSNQGNDCFQLQSFDKSKTVKINGTLLSVMEIGKAATLRDLNSVTEAIFDNENYTSQQDFESYIALIIKRCKEGTIQKSVAARKKKVDLPNNFNIGSFFEKACEKYPNAFIHLSFTNFGLWLGASPELLLANNEYEFSTVSLAGTKTVNENRNWTGKELEEQQIVTNFILETIENNGATVIVQSDTYTTQAGHLQHLKTDISFEAANKNDLLNALHPTPAVCGTPKDNAQQLIAENELYERSFYTGFIGLDAPQGFYYVNLRCMQFFEKSAAIYVGAGITKDSNPNAEWLETENKAQTMQALLTNL